MKARSEIAASGPDVVYFPVFTPESEFIATQLRNTPGLEETEMMVTDGSFSSTFAGNVGDAAVGIHMTSPYVAGAEYDEFLMVWDDMFGTDPPSGFHAHAYDATNILMDAVEAVAVEGDDGALMIGKQALRDAVSAVENYDGLTGTLTCQDESPYRGDCATGSALAVYEITADEVAGGWPPPVVWDMSMAMDMDEG